MLVKNTKDEGKKVIIVGDGVDDALLSCLSRCAGSWEAALIQLVIIC